MKLPIIVAMALLAGGCASREPLSWQRPGVSMEQQSEDTGRCRALALAVLQRDLGIDADLTSTMGHDWRAAGTFSMEKQSLESTSIRYAERVFDRCMEKKEYYPTEARR
jgi:hypothetical protein